MNESIIITLTFVMLSLCVFFIIILLTWNRRSLRHQRRIHEIQRETQRRLLSATISGQEKERKLISENLHDDIGPLLSSIKLQVHGNLRKEENVASINETIDLAISQLRRVSQELSPLVLEQHGLITAMNHFCGIMLEKAEIEHTIKWDGILDDSLSYDSTLAIFRIFQEAINNVVKHSNASMVSIIGELDNSGNSVIKIRDNGGGMHQDNEITGLGLKTMMARADSIGASLSIESDIHGTCLSLTLSKQ